VLEGMYRGVVPVVTGRAALLEKVIPNVTGYVVPAYGNSSRRYQDEFVRLVVDAMNMHPDNLDEVRKNCWLYASQFTYPRLVSQWVAEWERRLAEKGWQ